MASGDKFYLADKETLDEVNSKIGTTTDTGGSETGGTGFAKLNKIINSVLKIGTTTDTGGTVTTGTLMAKTNALLEGKGSGKISSEGKIYNPIMQEQLILIDKSPIIWDGSNYTGFASGIVIGKSYIYFYQQSSSGYYKLMALSLSNNQITMIHPSVFFEYGIDIKKSMNDNFFFFIVGSSSKSLYKVDLTSNQYIYTANLGANGIAGIYATNDMVYLWDKTACKILAYSPSGVKLGETTTLGGSGAARFSVNGNYLLLSNYTDGKLYLVNSQSLSLLAVFSDSYIGNVINYGEGFMCVSNSAGSDRIKLFEVNETSPSNSTMSPFGLLGGLTEIGDFDYFSDGSIMFYSSDTVPYGGLHMILSPLGEVTRLSDNHDYLNLQLVGSTAIDKNTDYIYKVVNSYRDVDPGPGDRVGYIGKFIKKYSVVGYELEG